MNGSSRLLLATLAALADSELRVADLSTIESRTADGTPTARDRRARGRVYCSGEETGSSWLALGGSAASRVSATRRTTHTSTLQTLDRGIRALVVVSTKPAGVSIAELAEELGIARAICYRIVATLETHGLVTRGADGRVYLGAGVLSLPASYWPNFLALATPTLQMLADETGATAFLSVAEGDDAVAVLSIDPTDAPMIRVGYRVGSRHPLTTGAAGIAILAGRPPAPDDPAQVSQARTLGYSITRGQLQPGAVGVAAPLRHASPGRYAPEAAIGVVSLEGFDTEGSAVRVLDAARSVGG